MKKSMFFLFAFAILIVSCVAQNVSDVSAAALTDQPVQEEASYMFYIYGIGGVLFHLIMKIRDAYSKREKFDWKTNGLFSLFSLATAVVLVVFRAEIFTYLGLSMTNFTVFLLGYFSDSVWKNVKSEKAKEFNVPDKNI